MKQLLFMGGLLIFLIACTGVPGSDAECVSDADCIVGGCSGTICASKNAEPVVTTCEFLSEYECYNSISCSCTNNKCAWDKTPVFEQCLVDKRAQASGP